MTNPTQIDFTDTQLAAVREAALPIIRRALHAVGSAPDRWVDTWADELCAALPAACDQWMEPNGDIYA